MSKVEEQNLEQGSGKENPRSNKKSKKNSRGYNPRNKGDRKNDRRDDDQKVKPKTINDIAWYIKYPSLVAGSSSHIFNAILGHKYQPVSINDTSNKQYFGYKQAIPGVVALRWMPWYSMKGTTTDAVNVASKNLYTYVRHANSGSVNYESSDMMQYVIAVAELFAFAEQCKRDLKLIFTYKATNRYLYQRVLWATGYTMANVQDMIDNYALYSNKLNILIAQLNSFKIPKEMSFLARHVWLASHVWKDDDLDKATTYVYYMQGFYSYDWQSSQLDFEALLPLNSSTMDFPTRLSKLAHEINTLLAYEDIGIMIGDILKAYGNDSCYFASPLLPGEVYEAEYSKEVTHQIRNATVLNNVYAPSICQVSGDSQLLYETQKYASGWPTVRPINDTTSTPVTMPCEDGVLYFRPMVNGRATNEVINNNPTLEIKPFLIIDADNPTNEEIILNTRLTCIVKSTGYAVTTGDPSTSAIFRVDKAGTEVISGGLFATFEGTLQSGSVTEETNAGNLGFIHDTSTIVKALHSLSNMYKIDDMPQKVFLLADFAQGGNIMYISTFYYGKNVISVEADWLNLLHDGCQMSEFTMPMFKLLEASK